MFTLLASKLWPFIIAIVLSAGLTGYTVHQMDEASITSIRLADARTALAATILAKNVQSQQDQITTNAAVAEAKAQQKIVTQTITVTKEVPVYVKNNLPCVSYGLVRVLDATILHTDPNTLRLPAGKSNDSCAPITTSALATAILNNYSLSQANAEQLTSLQAWVRGQGAIK